MAHAGLALRDVPIIDMPFRQKRPERRGRHRAMHQMKAAGMTHATAANSGTNEASRALYEACGFTPRHLIDDYIKPIPV